MIPVPDASIEEARSILASLTAEEVQGLSYPDEAQALARPAEFCRAMAKYILATIAPGLGEPDRSVRRAAYYLIAARLYTRRVNVARESLAMVHQGAQEFAMGEAPASSPTIFNRAEVAQN